MTVPDRDLLRSLRTNFTPGPRDRLNRVLLRMRQALHLPALLAGGRVDRPVFIIGAPRSGTSLLFSILRSSPALRHWPGEAHEVWEAYYHPALRGWDSNALSAGDVTDDAARYIQKSFFLVTGGNHRLIDKTPRNALRVGFVDAIFPDARFVFLQRDGRDNVNSLINAWRSGRYKTYRLPDPHAIPGVDPQWWKFVLYPSWNDDVSGPLEVVCAKQWHVSNDLAAGALEPLGDRVVTLRYEDLVEDAPGEVGRIMQQIDLPYDEVVRARAAQLAATPINVVTPPERGKWRRENPQEIHAILPLIAPTMERLGYSVHED